MVIGIGGVSRSGKSTLARLLVNHFRDSGKTAIALNQDDFVFPTSLIPMVKDKVDWESPLSVNHTLLFEVLHFYTSKFEIVIVDGFLAFYDERLVKSYDKKIFVSISKDTFLERKKQDLRWGFIPEWFFEHIWDSYQQYGIPDFTQNDFVRISGEEEYQIESLLS